MTESKYNCLNCGESIEFDDDSNFITTCENCRWRNELNDSPAIDAIVVKTKSFDDFSTQIAYPLIEEKDLEYLPESLKKAVISYFKEGDNFSKKDYQNIYHNLFSKNARDFKKIGMKYMQKAKLAEFFQNTNFTNLSWSEKLLKTMDRPIAVFKKEHSDHHALEIFELETLLEKEDSDLLEEYLSEHKMKVMDFWDFVESPEMEEWKHDYLWYSEKFQNILEKEASEWMKENWKELDSDHFCAFFELLKRDGEVWIETQYSTLYVVDDNFDWTDVADNLLSEKSKYYQDQISYSLEEEAYLMQQDEIEQEYKEDLKNGKI